MFNVNGIEWDIRFVNAGSKYLKRSDGTYTIGMTDGYTHTIYLARNLKGRMLDKVLSHELTHVILFSYGIEIDEELEERLAQWVSIYGRELVYLLDDLMDILNKKFRGII